MGCAATDLNQGISIENNLIALVVSGQTDLAISKIQQLGKQFDPNTPINFRGDTILHYACKKNNQKLVKYLLKHPKTLKSVRNSSSQLPKDLTTNKSIEQLCS